MKKKLIFNRCISVLIIFMSLITLSACGSKSKNDLNNTKNKVKNKVTDKNKKSKTVEIPKKISISTNVKELNSVSTKLDKEKYKTNNYQGYISIITKVNDESVKNIKRVSVSGIKFGKNSNGKAVMYRYNSPFNAQAVQIIYGETKKGHVYTTYMYLPKQFKNFGFQKTGTNEYTTKIQYLVMNVKSDISKKTLKRDVTFKMIYEFKNGKSISKNVKVHILK